MALPIRDFEVRLASMFSSGGFSAISPVGFWIKNHLLEVGEDYTRRMYERYLQFIEIAEQYGIKFKKPRYHSFINYILALRRLDLIRISRITPPVKKFAKPRRYYTVNPAKIDSPEWDRPLQTLYPTTDTRWRKIHGLPVYRKALKRPKKPRGRPRKTAF